MCVCVASELISLIFTRFSVGQELHEIGVHNFDIYNSRVVRSIYTISALPVDVTESKDRFDTSSDPFIVSLLNENLDIFTYITSIFFANMFLCFLFV